jgi:hypothetical protein
MNTEDQNINHTFQDFPSTTAKQADCNILYFVWVNVKKTNIKNAQLKTVSQNINDNVSLEAQPERAYSCK